ncbi:hypothetical protein QBC35DRAFT_523555 [Podospora australis]|uniref:Uncharacterized protein n=1 Tax=Podospora australis TaxID=1536484 RepID=A0AAN6WSP7_9PEZI|nr:hypothetical protein QBC35DRAFT_523555 [Podospora australis]
MCSDIMADQLPATSVEDLLTLIITTSPTPSAPSTELLEQITDGFRTHCPSITRCRVILVLDTYDHIMGKARLKRGQVTAEVAADFAVYKTNAIRYVLQEYAPAGTVYEKEDLVESWERAEFGSGAAAYAAQNCHVPLAVTRTRDGHITIIEPSQRLGFGLGVRSALRLTSTPYVWIQQHDWSLVADIPLDPLLRLMQETPESEEDDEEGDEENNEDVGCVKPPVKYVCFPSVRMFQYATSDHVMLYPGLRALTQLYKQNFTVASETGDRTTKIPLTPMFFWHDKPHIASTKHYLTQVFTTRLSMARGAFIEDTVGQRARAEMKEGNWKKWACWLYYPDDGKLLVLRHLMGRTWRGAEGALAKKMEYMRLNEIQGTEKYDQICRR